MNFRLRRKQSIAKSTYASCIGVGAAASVERGSGLLAFFLYVVPQLLAQTVQHHCLLFIQNLNLDPLQHVLHEGHVLGGEGDVHAAGGVGHGFGAAHTH